jgi:hypothetical protein
MPVENLKAATCTCIYNEAVVSSENEFEYLPTVLKTSIALENYY